MPKKNTGRKILKLPTARKKSTLVRVTVKGQPARNVMVQQDPVPFKFFTQVSPKDEGTPGVETCDHIVTIPRKAAVELARVFFNHQPTGFSPSGMASFAAHEDFMKTLTQSEREYITADDEVS